MSIIFHLLFTTFFHDKLIGMLNNGDSQVIYESMFKANLIKNLFFPIIILSFLIITPTFAQEGVFEVHNYKNISPVYYEYYNVPEFSPLLTRTFLILAAFLAILGGFFTSGAIQWMQAKVSERGSHLTSYSYIPQNQSPVLSRLNLHSGFGKKDKNKDQNET